MKNALNNQVGMLGDMFLWLVANLKQGVIYFIKQGGGNHKIAYLESLDLFPSILAYILDFFSVLTLEGNGML